MVWRTISTFSCDIARPVSRRGGIAWTAAPIYAAHYVDVKG